MKMQQVDFSSLYFGTPVAILSSQNPDGSTNLSPISSWWILEKHTGSTPKNGNHCIIFFVIISRSATNWEIISGVIISMAVRPRLFGALLYVLRKRCKINPITAHAAITCVTLYLNRNSAMAAAKAMTAAIQSILPSKPCGQSTW
ncbi:Uncharacterised protein [Enterobacter cloacae]|nr:Uncharacterised protein [Enterobacter cloacae]